MENKVVVDFGNILSELDSKDIKLCLLKDRGIFIEDNQKHMYTMETYHAGSYLDKLIKEGTTVEFNRVDDSVSHNIGDWEKEIWGVLEVNAFMESQYLLS